MKYVRPKRVISRRRRTTRVVLDLINVINGVAKLPQARLLITRFGRTYFMRGS